MEVRINRGLDGKFQKITEDLRQVSTIYGRKVSEQLVLYSPVDTGAYMDGFYAGSGYVDNRTSSAGRERNQPWENHAQPAVDRMTSGVSALMGSTRMVFGNTAEHSFDVEYEHGYRPFGKTANMHSELIREAWEEAKR